MTLDQQLVEHLSKKKMKTDLIVVLGMHRSGTSLITRSLATLGIFGNIMPGGKGNEKYSKYNDIVALNNQLLEESNMTCSITLRRE